MRNRSLLLYACMLAAFLAAAAAQKPEPNREAGDAQTWSGERLVYRIQWDPPWYLFFLPKMDAGEVAVEFTGDAEYGGKKAAKIALKANSSGTLAKLAGVSIEDEYVFHTDPETLCTIAASEKIREGKRMRQVDVQYFRDTGTLHIREMDESMSPPKVKKDETKENIPACVHDPLSALFMFRQLPLREQFSSTFVLANDDKVREVIARIESQEEIEMPSGRIKAWRVSTAALMGGLFKEGGQFRIWLSADEKKVPVQFDVKVRLGHVFGKLKT